MSGLPRIQSVPLEEKQSALSVMLLAFSGDPFFRWFIPEPAKYVKGGIALMNAFGGGKAIENGTAFAPSNYEGASFWLPPGVSIDEQLVGQAIMESVPNYIQEELFAVFGEMASYRPEGDCWYLPLIGVDPAHQGRGLGSMMLKHALNIIDEKGLPAFLESSNPANISLYERHGFEVVGRIQVGSSPAVHPMHRAPVS